MPRAAPSGQPTTCSRTSPSYSRTQARGCPGPARPGATMPPPPCPSCASTTPTGPVSRARGSSQTPWRRCAAGEPVVLNFPDRVRDFVFVDDVAASFLVVLDDPVPGLREEDIGTGAGTRLVDMAAPHGRRLLGQPTDLVAGSRAAPGRPASLGRRARTPAARWARASLACARARADDRRSMMRWLVTGGAGFIGTNLVSHLIDPGTSRSSSTTCRGAARSCNAAFLQETYGIGVNRVDVSDRRGLASFLAEQGRFDAIAHLAGQVSFLASLEDPRRDFEVNALGTLNILEHVRLQLARDRRRRHELQQGLRRPHAGPHRRGGDAVRRPRLPGRLRRGPPPRLPRTVRLLEGRRRPVPGRLRPHVRPAHRQPAPVVRLRAAPAPALGPGLGRAPRRRGPGRPHHPPQRRRQAGARPPARDRPRPTVRGARRDGRSRAPGTSSTSVAGVDNSLSILELFAWLEARTGPPSTSRPVRRDRATRWCSSRTTRSVSALTGWSPEVSVEQGLTMLFDGTGR